MSSTTTTVTVIYYERTARAITYEARRTVTIRLRTVGSASDAESGERMTNEDFALNGTVQRTRDLADNVYDRSVHLSLACSSVHLSVCAAVSASLGALTPLTLSRLLLLKRKKNFLMTST